MDEELGRRGLWSTDFCRIAGSHSVDVVIVTHAGQATDILTDWTRITGATLRVAQRQMGDDGVGPTPKRPSQWRPCRFDQRRAPGG